MLSYQYMLALSMLLLCACCLPGRATCLTDAVPPAPRCRLQNKRLSKGKKGGKKKM